MPVALLTTLLFALTAVCATQASLLLGSNRANAARLAVAAIILALWAHLLGGGLGGGQLDRLMLAGAIGFGLGGFCMFQAFPRIGSTLSLLCVESAATLTTTVLAWLVFGAGISLLQALSAFLCVSGVIVALVPFRLPKVPREILLAGILFALLAAVFQGISWTLTKSVFIAVSREGVSLDPLTAAYQRLLGGLLLAIIILWIQRVSLKGRFGKKGEDSRHPPPGEGTPFNRFRAAGWVLGNALAGPVLGVSCMLWAIREVGNPGLVQAVVATATLITVPMARRLEGRVFGINYFVGAGLSILGIAGLLLFPHPY